MGRAYESELAALGQTYQEVLQREGGDCVHLVRSLAGSSLLIVASGGSTTAAEALATFHQVCTGQLARVVTPLELAAYSLDLRSMSAVLLSAGGRNPDILGAFEHLVSKEPRHLFVLCGNDKSPLAARTNETSYAALIHVASPQGKDGFLATNSLLAFVTAVGMAYSSCYAGVGELPTELPASWLSPIPVQRLDRRDHLLVLFDPMLRHAAIDIESRFSEAVLGTVSLADFRNFAHGRHVWLALRSESTAIVALFRKEQTKIAERTLQLLPKNVPVIPCAIDGTLIGDVLQSLLFSLHLAGAVGRKKGIDPGRPHVPQFGRQLYNARLIPQAETNGSNLAVYRKSGTRTKALVPSLKAFVDGLKNARLGAVVLDYDGTICSHTQRFGDAHEESSTELARLIRGGVRIGIATGRGKSVAEALRKSLPQDTWKKVDVGYYNCGLIVNLAETPPGWTSNPDPSLKRVFEELMQDPSLVGRADIELRDTQVTVKPRDADVSCDDLLALCAAYAGRPSAGLAVVRSTHSIDVLPRHVNKTLLLDHLTMLGTADILTIGDQGRWPGNDFALLDSGLSLSVDGTSPSWSTCWNLAPRGLRGPAATAHYLSACTGGRGGWHIDVAKLLGEGWE